MVDERLVSELTVVELIAELIKLLDERDAEDRGALDPVLGFNVVGQPMDFQGFAEEYYETRPEQTMGKLARQVIDNMPTHMLYANGNLSEWEEELMEHNNNLVNSSSTFWLSVKASEGKKYLYMRECQNFQGGVIARTKVRVLYGFDLGTTIDREQAVREARAWAHTKVHRAHMKDQKKVEATGFEGE